MMYQDSKNLANVVFKFGTHCKYIQQNDSGMTADRQRNDSGLM